MYNKRVLKNYVVHNPHTKKNVSRKKLESYAIDMFFEVSFCEAEDM